MTKKEALMILGLRKMCSQEALKKKYRSMMLIAHPDANQGAHPSIDARDINLAYEYLMKNTEDLSETEMFTRNAKDSAEFCTQKKTIRWNAPINPAAYRERNIYHKIEDLDGMVIGETILDTGKYYWTEDEEFPLFLKSLYECGKNIIFDYDYRDLDSDRNKILLSKLVYLLSQQYVDSEMVFSRFCDVISEHEIYRIGAMLEMQGHMSLKEGEMLYPSMLRNHRLYVRNEKGKELGYLSFKDDRLYYGVIPLLERKAAQVKIQVRDYRSKRTNYKRYQDIDLYIKLCSEQKNSMIESVNVKINKLLQE